MADIETELRNWLFGAKKIVVAGIGNPIRSDDYVGLKIIEDMQGKVPENVQLVECETVLKASFRYRSFRPHVLLVDAAILA
jgi:hydrogenase maturation protease